MLLLFLLMFYMDGVSAETEAVMEGDSVTLHTNLSEILNDDTILWLFGPKDAALSQITRKGDFTSIYFTDDVRFSGRLQVDQNTGSLTVSNTRIRHSGQYKLSISREKTTIKIFHVTVFGVVGKTDEVKSESVKEGESVTLNADVEVQRDDLIVWRFGDKGILLAKIDVETKGASLNDDDERFRDRLKIDHQTGSLTITNTKTEHTGLYELQIRGRESSQRFLLSVTAVSGPGLSPGALAGIVVFAVLLAAAVLAAVVIYYRRKISQLLEKKESVKEGGTLHLHTVTELHKGDKIQWYYEDEREDNLIAEINKETMIRDGADGRFLSKLSLDDKTGDLTINNIKTIHSGLYILKISSKKTTKYKRFIVIVTAEMESEAKGQDVPLETGVVKIQTGDLILWTFGAKNCLVARADSEKSDITVRFRGRLDLDKTTGSLTIKNIKNTEYGHYKLQIINQKQTTFRRFIVLGPAERKSVAEGENVLLKTGVNKIQPDDLMLWMFGDKNCLVATVDSGTPDITERFRGRMDLDPQTGSLTIRNITNTEYGHYKLQIINKEQTTFKRFNVLDSDDPGKRANEETPLMNQEKKNYDVLVLQGL